MVDHLIADPAAAGAFPEEEDLPALLNGGEAATDSDDDAMGFTENAWKTAAYIRPPRPGCSMDQAATAFGRVAPGSLLTLLRRLAALTSIRFGEPTRPPTRPAAPPPTPRTDSPASCSWPPPPPAAWRACCRPWRSSGRRTPAPGPGARCATR